MYDYLLLLGRLVHGLSTDGSLAELRDSKLAVLLAVLSFLNGEKRETTAGVKAIATRADIPESTVYRVLHELIQGGFLTNENRVIGLGHKLSAIAASHERRVRTVNQQSCSNNSYVLTEGHVTETVVELSEPQTRACVRKNTATADIRQLVLRYGSEHVDKAILEMQAQYPSDDNVRISFGALVRRACEHGWVSQRRDQIEAKQRQQSFTGPADQLSSLPSEVTVLTDPDGRKLPIIRRTPDAIIVQTGVDGAGVPKEAVIRPADLTLFSWEAS